MYFSRLILTLSLASLCFVAQPSAKANQNISRQIQKEFVQMQTLVRNLKSDYNIGGVMEGKNYGDYEILWWLAQEPGDTEVIRIYREKPGQQAFDVSYFLSTQIVEGRTVIRRFVGPSTTGWRNDTIDAETGEYLGQQGVSEPSLERRDREILKEWGIKLFK